MLSTEQRINAGELSKAGVQRGRKGEVKAANQCGRTPVSEEKRR